MATSAVSLRQTRSHPDPSLLICFSHLRWNLVFQRPHHLLTRAASSFDVLFFEEPVFEAVEVPVLRLSGPYRGVNVLTPVLPRSTDTQRATTMQRVLLDRLIAARRTKQLVLWYYTPMALPFSDHIDSDVCVYDCMDELAAFKNAPREIAGLERMLIQLADIVFTGGQSLYEAKRRLHPRIYPFPSGIDTAHFAAARKLGPDPSDQSSIPRERIGYFGVIDERLDMELIAHAARNLPDKQFVMIGPVVKISHDDLPVLPNIHWLGKRSYDDLPLYLRHWDVGWMPFSLNESTRFISPTKTPEFLAAGLPVVSTAIVDVVRTYAARGLVEIADRSNIVSKLQASSLRGRKRISNDADALLRTMSWDATWQRMLKLVNEKLHPERGDYADLRV